jgi:hypothetical protein
MSLFVCDKCKTIENTALCDYAYRRCSCKTVLCSYCQYGKWHGRFKREKFDPMKWEYYTEEYVQRKK